MPAFGAIEEFSRASAFDHVGRLWMQLPLCADLRRLRSIGFGRCPHNRISATNVCSHIQIYIHRYSNECVPVRSANDFALQTICLISTVTTMTELQPTDGGVDVAITALIAAIAQSEFFRQKDPFRISVGGEGMIVETVNEFRPARPPVGIEGDEE